jgi:hypothetical protein
MTASTARATDAKPRSDEIGELVRDFDVMAGRIEALVASQRQLISDISHEIAVAVGAAERDARGGAPASG